MTRYSITFGIVVVAAMTATASAQLKIAHPPQPPITATMPPRMTYPTPTEFSEVRGGTAFALVPHQEAYHLGQPMFVGFWFRTLAPEKTYFRARSDVRFVLIDPHGVPLTISQSLYKEYSMRVLDKGVGALNGDSFHVSLSDLYNITVPGTYTLTATVNLQYPKGVVLTAPPVSILIEK